MPDRVPENPERHDDDARLLDGTPGTDGATERETGTAGATERETGTAGATERETGTAGADDTRASRNARAGKRTQNVAIVWLKEIVTVVAIALVLSFLLKTFLFRAFWIPSESMEATLDVNDRIFINLLVPGPFDVARGDVVVFKDSQGWLTPIEKKPAGPMDWVGDTLEFVGLMADDSEQHLVKRVIGLPGDHVTCCDAGGRVSINGVPLDETYINPAEVPTPDTFDVVVPEGKVWVMGDNRNHSADSRLHQEANGGFINIEDVEGKAEVIAWPISRWSVLDSHSDVFKNVPAGTTGK
ncbi:signal peptidase I [Paenarthrobacter ureafaciens]|uniref:signal peptidase I n=1 Tax=Paenarthrobacter TaxID=1742992 RepID=UPI002231E3AB|nr:signal peptidase I [Paenarthrobacter sp. PAE-2]MCW3766964.1 signal peptidase I [Paenarthrobacter sp. PAE-2]